jgi:hypothetical protein
MAYMSSFIISPNINSMIIPRRMRWNGHIAWYIHTRENKTAHVMSVRKSAWSRMWKE